MVGEEAYTIEGILNFSEIASLDCKYCESTAIAFDDARCEDCGEWQTDEEEEEL